MGAGTMTAWTGSGFIVSSLFTAATAVLLVGNVRAGVYGDYVIMTSTALMLSVAVRLGVDRMIVGEVRRSDASGGETAGSVVGRDLLATSLVSATVLGLVVITPLGHRVVSAALSRPLEALESLALYVLVVAEAVRLTASEAARSRFHAGVAVVVGNGGRAPTLFVCFCVMTAVVDTPDRRLALVIAATVSALLATYGLVRCAPWFRWWRGRAMSSLAHRWRGHVAMNTAALSATAIGAADIWVVGLISDSTTAGRYAAAVSAAAAVAVVLSAVHFALQPYLTIGAHTSEPAEVETIARRFARRSTTLGGVLLAAVVVAVEPLAVAVGGDSYHGIRPLVALLGGGVVVALAVGPAGTLLAVNGHYRVLGRIALASACVAFSGELALGLLTRNDVAVAAVSGGALILVHSLAWHAVRQTLGLRTDAFGSAQQRPRRHADAIAH